MNELAKQVAESAEKIVEFCRSQFGDLDYSETSLAVVEEALGEMSEFVQDLDSEPATGMIEDFGCYILEVGRRTFGGRFQWFAARNQPVLVVEGPELRVALIAWDKVRGRLGGDKGDNIPFFFAGFAECVRKAEPGTDVLYV